MLTVTLIQNKGAEKYNEEQQVDQLKLKFVSALFTIQLQENSRATQNLKVFKVHVFIFGFSDLICKIPMSGFYRFLAFVTTFVSSNGKVFSPNEQNI